MDDHARLGDRIAAALSRPAGRPLALSGRSGCGKTTLLRGVVASTGKEPVWLSAFDLVNELVTAMRQGRLSSYSNALADDARPLCVEHLEDMRERPHTRAELQHLLQRASKNRPVVLTLTRSRHDSDVTRWLRPWTDFVSLD
jgi:chromosomal replication initiation ATPase DnaA